MKITNARVALMGWLLFLLAILSGMVAKAIWQRVDASLVTFIVFAAGFVVIAVWNRHAWRWRLRGGHGIDDTGDRDGSAGDGGAGGC